MKIDWEATAVKLRMLSVDPEDFFEWVIQGACVDRLSGKYREFVIRKYPEFLVLSPEGEDD